MVAADDLLQGAPAMRLVKYLAHAGVASRRSAEELIAAGRVSIAGETVTDPARDVQPDSPVALDGRALGGPGRGGNEVGLTIHEGRNRQVRRMCEAVGHPVLELRRTGFGPLRLAGLEEGAHRRLSPAEAERLRALVGDDPVAL